jgi:DNA-binding FadR family transcriptional regulator
MASDSVSASAPAYRESLSELILERSAEAFERPDGRLPTERQLAADLGVSRTTVRHALAALEAEGRISREVGRGTFVRRGSATRKRKLALSEDAHDVAPAHVMAVRRVFEPQVLPLVIAWATSRDFDEMQRCVEGGAAAGSYDEFEVWDFALHHAIVAASANPLLVEMYGEIERARKGQLWGNLKRLRDTAERRAVYQSDHVDLVEALKARDLPRATETMELHLRRVETSLLGAEHPEGA